MVFVDIPTDPLKLLLMLLAGGPLSRDHYRPKRIDSRSQSGRPGYDLGYLTNLRAIIKVIKH